MAPVSPVDASLQDVRVPAVRAVSQNITLTTTENPLLVWFDVATTTASNVTNLGAQYAANPVPVLRQVLVNQAGFTQTAITSIQGAVTGAATFLSEQLPAALAEAAELIAQGQPAEAINGFLNQVNFDFIYGVGYPMFALVRIPGKITDNLTAMVNAATNSYVSLLPLFGGVMNALQAPLMAAGIQAQNFVDASAAGDPMGAINALLNIPAAMVDGLLNGTSYVTESGGVTRRPGLFSPDGWDAGSGGGGLLQSLLINIPQYVAEAIGAPDFAGISALSTASSASALSSTAEATQTTIDDQPPGAEGTEATDGEEASTTGPQEDDTTEEEGTTDDGTTEAEGTEEGVTEAEGTEEGSGNAGAGEEDAGVDDSIGGQDDRNGTEDGLDPDDDGAPNGATDLTDGNKADPNTGTTSNTETDTGSNADTDEEVTDVDSGDTDTDSGGDNSTGGGDGSGDGGGSGDSGSGGGDS